MTCKKWKDHHSTLLPLLFYQKYESQDPNPFKSPELTMQVHYTYITKKRGYQSLHLSPYLCSNMSDTRSDCKLVFKGFQAIHRQKRNSRIHHLRQCQALSAGSQELTTLKRQILNTIEPQRFLAYHQIKWKFIREQALGFYEPLIELVKQRLKKAIGNTSLNFIGYTQQSPTHLYVYRYFRY